MHSVGAIAVVVIKELYRRKDFYVLFVLTALITLLMASMSFFNDRQVVRYLKEICLLLIWISSLVIAMVTSARQIPAERESRTIFPLLAKPVTRGQVLLGKFFGCWAATGLALVVFYLFFGVIALSRETEWMLAGYFQAWWLHWWMLGVVIAMVLWGSLVFAAPSSNVTILLVIVVGILLLGRHLGKVAARLSEPMQTIVYVVYYGMPHLEFFDVRDLLTHQWGAIPWWACGLATVYALIYTALFLTGAWWSFQRTNLGER
ncbi:MAG TPA: ABC transporter permease [Candidatus Paceibacterota bacterium]|nr:ABC transporter permease [Verrucomicrobiota bacterium]HRY47796.1 ABC transporter permease [Candidatus Paceibacterota bacterium]HSA00727.1 ABC transporter permease [Candidatus Paceibacterota bacterium]